MNPSRLLTPYSGYLNVPAAPTGSHIYTLPPRASKQPPAFALRAQVYSTHWEGLKLPYPAYPILHCLERLSKESPVQTTRELQAISLPVISGPPRPFQV